jgi:hypothetical protein
VSHREASGRWQLLQALAGIALIVLGAFGLLWLVFDDDLRSGTVTSANLTVWAIVRPSAAVALGAGTWLLAVAVVNRRRQGPGGSSARGVGERDVP